MGGITPLRITIIINITNMETKNFERLIQSVTGRDLLISTNDATLEHGKEYKIYRVLPITNMEVRFYWKVALTEEKMLKSFITAFCSKYREPNPRAYDYYAKNYGEKERWENKSEEAKEYAYGHHSSNMLCKASLMLQIEENFKNPEIEQALLEYGFYNTEYGVGIFCFWETPFVVSAIDKMKEYLKGKNIPYTNEYSDARWVFRFKLNLTKEVHRGILLSFSNSFK